ncbi:S-adenosyl-L-methionine-dependent methyltransferase [Lophiotrema nucula]|uniref:S-adenosyl-L-methionine-dependent methyltransferase n=1 Tax=Lophiotrema nucula TaxID=690887 RepID=A0A6A5YK69_9PLEO|nr:S-adenosyl-L-methionine-dependent methyltransferase [Lophiotrema nucula]
MDVSTIIKALDNAATDHSISDADKAQLHGACISAASILEPFDKKLLDMLFAPLRSVALRLAIDMRIFDVCAAIGKERVTLKELSNESKCEALLIKRIMRVLIDMKIFNEVDIDAFEPTQAASLYRYDAPMAQIIIHWTTHLPQVAKLPDYFAEKGYESPTDSMDCPFQYAMGTKLHNFDWIASDPRIQHAFNVMMTVRTQRGVDSKWFEVFPIERLITDEPALEVFLVDVGGGIGHQTVGFKDHHPSVWRMIVQDIAPVIDSIKSLPDGIEGMVHDFFKPQPVKGAKVYFLAHVLHDWPDKQARVILDHVRNAMALESIVLLSETVMPERGASFAAAAMDITMMTAYASLERTERQFRDLLDEAGLTLVNVWSEKNSGKEGASMLGQSILEARLK